MFVLLFLNRPNNSGNLPKKPFKATLGNGMRSSPVPGCTVEHQREGVS